MCRKLHHDAENETPKSIKINNQQNHATIKLCRNEKREVKCDLNLVICGWNREIVDDNSLCSI